MKYMRILAVWFCFAFIVIKFDITAFASSSEYCGIEILSDIEADYFEISHMEENILNSLKNFYQQVKGAEIPEDFTLDISQAAKIYVDTPVFSLEHADDIKHELQNGNYMWLLSVNIGKDTFQIHIARGLPLRESAKDMLTEAQIEQIKEREGKWSLSGIELLEGENIDFEQQISDALKNWPYEMKDTEILLCGGLEHISNPAAIVMNGKKAEWFLPLYDLQIDGTDEQIADIKPKSAGKEDKIYIYDAIKDAVNSMPSFKDYSGSGSSSYIVLKEKPKSFQAQWYILAACAVLAIIAVQIGNRLQLFPKMDG